MIKKSIFLNIIISFLVYIFFIPISNATSITIASGSVFGSYYAVSLQICSMVTKYNPSVKCDVLPTSGSLNNLNLLEEKTVDFALMQSDVIHDALRSVGIFANQPQYNNLRLVLNLFPESFNIISRDNAGIRSFYDIVGKKVGVNLNGSGSKNGLLTLFRYYNFNPSATEDTNIVHVHESQMLDKLCSGKIDSIVIFSAHPNTVIEETSKKCDVEFVTIDEMILEALLAENPVYERFRITGRSYKSIARDFNSFSTRAMLVTVNTTDREKINILRDSILRNFEEFKKKHPVLEMLKRDQILISNILDLKSF